MALCSKALPPTASRLSPMPGFESRPGHTSMRNFPVSGGGFRRAIRFLPSLQLASDDFAAIWQKSDDNRNSKFQIRLTMTYLYRVRPGP